MALPPIIFTSQKVTVYSPRDTSIDKEKTDQTALSKYNSCEDLDVSALVLKKDDDPVKFVIRALSPAENDLVGCLVYNDTGDGSGLVNPAIQTIEVMLHAVRFGLMESDLDGWADGAERSRINGSTVEGWSEHSIAAIDSETRLFLGRAILSLSNLDQKKTGDLAARAPIPMEPRRKKQRRKARSQAL